MTHTIWVSFAPRKNKCYFEGFSVEVRKKVYLKQQISYFIIPQGVCLEGCKSFN